MPTPKIGDELVGLSPLEMRALPEGIILEANSEAFAMVAYRVATVGWTITGHGSVENNSYMSRIPARWIVRYVP
jgi:hypothetical protein